MRSCRCSDRAATNNHPKTRESLSTFPELSDVEMLAFDEAGQPRLGVSVKSKAQGEALIAHLRPSMKDDLLRLVCYAPVKPRKIAVKAAKKK